MQITTKLAHMVSLQLQAIVDNDAVQNFESVDDIFRNEFHNTSLNDGCYYLGLDSLSEILACHDDKLFLSFALWEWS